jgi:hypothetical protein
MDNRQKMLDAIDKAGWLLMTEAKNAVSVNLTTATKSKQLKIDEATLQQLLALVVASLDEGYSRGTRVFSRTVKDSVDGAWPKPEPRKARA